MTETSPGVAEDVRHCRTVQVDFRGLRDPRIPSPVSSLRNRTVSSGKLQSRVRGRSKEGYKLGVRSVRVERSVTRMDGEGHGNGGLGKKGGEGLFDVKLSINLHRTK